jgi:uncharacterized damage-inducible protein DinB
MKPFFKNIFEYHHQVNQKLADQILEHLDRIPEDSQKLFSHVLNAHQIWNSRILLQQPLFKVWDMQIPQQYKQIDLQNYRDTLGILDQADFSTPVTYTNSQGQVFTNTVRDILFHVNNHSTHHKAQLASRFRALDIKPW